jgi:CheY-like chemotaxis protein
MKIIVVDDHIDPEQIIRGALASGSAAGSHSVRGVRTPEELDRISDLDTYRLAFVDMSFPEPVKNSGLLALRLLAEARVPAVIYSAEAEDNRLLFLLAAFQFFEPRGLVPKGTSSAEIHKIVTTLESGAWPDSQATERYKPPRVGLSILDQLIVRESDLPIWQALAEYTGRHAIAEAANVSHSKVDDFLNEHYDIVTVIEEAFQLRVSPRPLPDVRSARTKTAREYAHRMPRLYSFAVVHRRFFADPEVEKLIRRRDSPPPSPVRSRPKRPHR